MYFAVKPKCGTVLIANSSSQVFLSPGYPNMENTNCEWIITAATKMNVMLNLVDFEMDTTSALFVWSFYLNCLYILYAYIMLKKLSLIIKKIFSLFRYSSYEDLK